MGSGFAWVCSKLPVSSSPLTGALCPAGGLIFLYDRKQVRSFRKDGHSWRKKQDNRTIRETHEKLKVHPSS